MKVSMELVDSRRAMGASTGVCSGETGFSGTNAGRATGDKIG